MRALTSCATWTRSRTTRATLTAASMSITISALIGHTSATARCFTPSTTWRDQERNTHQSQELRVTTPADWRIRGVGGLFYESYRIQDQGDGFT